LVCICPNYFFKIQMHNLNNYSDWFHRRIHIKGKPLRNHISHNFRWCNPLHKSSTPHLCDVQVNKLCIKLSYPEIYIQERIKCTLLLHRI
jgi:hypothetical protein